VRLQQNIFLWIAISVILPLTIIILALTLYGERLYRQQITQQINASLSNISTDLERSLANERDIILRISSSFAMRQYLPVLDDAGVGEMHAEFNMRTDRLNRFLRSFHDIMLGQGTFRVLDLRGNTLVKVGFGRITPPSFDGFESFPFAEHQGSVIEPAKMAQLADLNVTEVSFLALLSNNQDGSLLDGVVPLSVDDKTVGYLVSSLTGLQLDYILQLAPRPYQGKLSVIEINPDVSNRHGRVLYDESRSQLLASDAAGKATAPVELLNAIQEHPDGKLINRPDNTTTYFYETFPYPDRLLSWVIAIQIDDEIIASPFRQLRWGILIFSLLILAVSLLVAQFAAAKVARPLAMMIDNFRAMSKGEHTRSLPRSRTEELNELSVAFNEMRENLGAAENERDRARDMMVQNAKLASIGQLAAGIGHELNNPLNNILSYASLIRREAGQDAEAVVKDVDALRDEAERASKIVQGILGFSRQMPASFGELSVTSLLQQSIDLVQATAQKKHIDIRLHIDEEYPVTGDRGLLQQALINLLINAIQASPQQATVNVYARKGDSHHLITVEDVGEGIDDDAIDHLFEPFFTTKDVGEGSGLGLSITLGIVEQHQGALQLENRYDADGGLTGVSATMALPVTMEIDNE
jgi:two-component system NtrC family sensor kinase